MYPAPIRSCDTHVTLKVHKGENVNTHTLKSLTQHRLSRTLLAGAAIGALSFGLVACGDNSTQNTSSATTVTETQSLGDAAKEKASEARTAAEDAVDDLSSKAASATAEAGSALNELTTSPNASDVELTVDDAFAKAFEDAGVDGGTVSARESELDYDDGRAVWEVSFTANDQKFDYDIDANTGEILSKDQD